MMAKMKNMDMAAKAKVLDDIIEMCDEAATNPFKKKGGEDSGIAIMEESAEPMAEEKDEGSDDTLSELLEAYEAKKKMKDEEEA